MVTSERIISYLHSLDCDSDPVLQSMEQDARKQEVPIIRPETRELLKVLIVSSQPKRILEIGTAIGYSAICMSRYMPEDGHITTIENYEPRIREAKMNFRLAGVEQRITLLEGDAMDVLKELEGKFDLIFVDAAKGQYIYYLPEVMRLLASKGLLVSDNVLQDGDILESRYAVEKRNRTIHSRMREYLYALKHDDRLMTAILPVGDGVALSTKLQDDGWKDIERQITDWR